MGLCLGTAKDVSNDVKSRDLSTVDKAHGVRHPSATSSSGSDVTAPVSRMSSQESSGSFTRLTRSNSVDERYELEDRLGAGAVAVVHKARRKDDGEEFAIKKLTKSKLYPGEVKDLMREVQVLKTVDHPNVIKLYEFDEDDQHYYLVVELVKGGELLQRIIAKTVYTEAEARDLFVTLVTTIEYLHSQDVVHRDLKLENLLMAGEEDHKIKIADFGFAVKVDNQERCPPELRGTPRYIAPEIIKGDPYGKPVDMWSVGVITYMLVGGFAPFHDDDVDALFEKIKLGEFRFSPSLIWELISDEAKDLISGLLTVDPEKRLTAKQALEHPWVSKPHEILRQNTLEATQVELRKFNARRTFRAGVTSVMAANRMNALLKLRPAPVREERDEEVKMEETAASEGEEVMHDAQSQ